MAPARIPMSKKPSLFRYLKHYCIINTFNLHRINISNDEALPFVVAQLFIIALTSL